MESVKRVLKQLQEQAKVLQEHKGESGEGARVLAEYFGKAFQEFADRFDMAIKWDEAKNGDPCPGCGGTGYLDKLQSSSCPNCRASGMVFWMEDETEEKVSLPSEFVATRFPGYFWNTNTQTLYSIKIDGVLKELKIVRPNHFNNLREPAYRVSVQGYRRYMFLSLLEKLTPTESEIPVKG